MPTYPHLRLVRPAGQIIEVESPNRLALRERLGVTSLPPVTELSEEAAGSMTAAEFGTRYCIDDGTEAGRAARPWCEGRWVVALGALPTAPPALAPRYPTTPSSPAPPPPSTPRFPTPPASPAPLPPLSPMPPPPAPTPTPVGPLVPGYSTGRIAPTAHYPTWIGTRYILGDERGFLLEKIPADDYYRLIDRLAIGGPAAFHQAVRIEATRWGVLDPLAAIANLDAIIAAQQADYIAHNGGTTTQPAVSRGWIPVVVVVGIGAALWALSRKRTTIRR